MSALGGLVVLLLGKPVRVLDHRRNLLPERPVVEVRVRVDHFDHAVEDLQVVHRREIVPLGADDVEALGEEQLEERLLLGPDRVVLEHDKNVQVDRHGAFPSRA